MSRAAATMDEKPGLVIWQASTVDAIRGVDPDGQGVAMLQAQGVYVETR